MTQHGTERRNSRCSRSNLSRHLSQQRRASGLHGKTKQWDPVSRTFTARSSGGRMTKRWDPLTLSKPSSRRSSFKSMDLEMQRSGRNPNLHNVMPGFKRRSGCSPCAIVIIIITLLSLLACVLGCLFISEEEGDVPVNTEGHDQGNQVAVALPPSRPTVPGKTSNDGEIAVCWAVKRDVNWGAALKVWDPQFWRSDPHGGALNAHVTVDTGIDRDGLFKIVSKPWLYSVVGGTPAIGFDEDVLKKLNAEVDATKSDLCNTSLSDKRKAKVKQTFSEWFKSLKKHSAKLEANAVGWRYTFYFRKSEIKKNLQACEEFQFGKNIANAHRFMSSQTSGGNNPAMLGYIVGFEFRMLDSSGKDIPEGSKRYSIL